MTGFAASCCWARRRSFSCSVAIEAKAGQRACRTEARPLAEALATLTVRGMAADAWRLGLVVTRGREVEQFAPGVWAVPDWRLFGPA